MLARISRVTFKKNLPFEDIVDLLRDMGYQCHYRNDLHPLVAKLEIRPQQFFVSELVTHRKFPTTISLVTTGREASHTGYSSLERQILRQRAALHGREFRGREPTSLFVLTGGINAIHVEKLHEGILSTLRHRGRATTVVDADIDDKLHFEKHCARRSPTGKVLEDTLVIRAIAHLEDSTSRKVALMVKRSQLVLDNRLSTLAGSVGMNESGLRKKLSDLGECGVLQTVVVAYCCDRLVNIIGLENKVPHFLRLAISCPNCHKVLTKDKLLHAYRLVEAGEKALDQAAWLVGVVASTFRQFGCNQMIVGRFMDSDEVDLIVFYLGRTIVVECSDKSVELGDAYKFLGKLNTIDSWPGIGPDIGVIITTDRFNPDAQRFLNAGSLPGRAEMHYVEGDADRIRMSISELVNEMTKSYFAARLVP